MPRRFVLWLVSLIALGNWGLAQEPTETARPRLDSTRFGNDVPPRDEHVIYVPYTKLRDVFEKQGASVLLPYAQFLQLWSGMPGPAIPLPIKPPLAGLISRADYVGKVEGDQARIEATLTLEVLGEEWARLPVSFGDAAVGAVRGDQEPVLLRGLGDGNYELLLKGRGTRRVAFELMARVLPVADGKGITIQCPPVGLSSLELEVDQSDISVQVNPRRIAQIRSEKNRTRIQATLGATDRFSVTWQPKAGVADEQAGLASVSDIFEIDVGDGIIHTHAVFDYQILRGSLDSLVIGLPADQRLLDVQAPGMRDWETEADAESAGRQRLVVRLHAPTRDRVRLELHTESAIPEQSFPVASFHAIGVARESGVIAVRSAEDVGLEYVTHSGVSRVDAPDVPEPLRKPRSTFYKFFSPNFQLAASAVTLEPRVVVESFLTITLEKARLSLRGEFKFDVTRAGVFAVPLRLPPEFHVDEVQCDLMDRHETTTAAEGQILTVYLGRKVLGTLKLTVVASQPRVAQSGELTLPLLEPMGISREQGLIAVIAPDSIEVNSDPAKLEGARPATPAELATRGFQPQSVKGSTLAAAFAFTSRPVQIGLATRERPRRVLAQVFTVASVKEDLITVNTDIRYDIQYAGTDTFRLAVPAVFADRVQISGEGIKEKRKAEEPESDGTIIWTVVLHSEAIGGRTLNLSYDAHISVPDKGVSQEIQPVRALDVDRETGEIAILKDRALAIAANQEGLEEIDSRELTQPAGKDQPYLSYRYFRHPANLTLDVTKHELEGVVRTVVSRGYVEAVVSSEGPVSVRARYWVKSSERQRLAVTLPALRLLGVTVAGRSVLPEKAPQSPSAAPEDKTYFVNIDRQTGPDEAFPIALVYEAPAPPSGKLGVTDQLRLRLPQFENGVKFQQLYVRLWLPEEYRAIGEPPGFDAETRLVLGQRGFQHFTTAPEEPGTWFPGDSAAFDFRTAGRSYLYGSLTAPEELVVRYWKFASMTLAGSLAVMFAGVVLLAFRFESRVLLLLTAVLGCFLAGMFWPESVAAWLIAARIGGAGVLALWLVIFLLRVRRAIPMRAAAASAGAVLIGTVATSPGTVTGEPPPAPGPPSAQAQDHPSNQPGQNNVRGKEKGGSRDA